MKHYLLSAALLFSGAVLAQATSTGSGQAYPSKPIKFIVPFTAGSATDIVARTVGDAMSKSMGQPIMVGQDVISVHQRDLYMASPPGGSGRVEFDAMVRKVDRIDSSWRE